MKKIAVLGYGTVGSGVVEIIQQNGEMIGKRIGEDVEIGYICDIRDYSNDPNSHLFVKDITPILQDPEVAVVVETIGGTKPAYDFVCRSLESGKSVATSNKELVATYGADLLKRAKNNNVCFLFEASVGGGTPIITPLHQCLAANNMFSIEGIVNGTTNFMLAKMEHEGLDFEHALKQAQDLGYAETIDPSSDVDGIDACRKIAILASLACGRQISPQNVPTRGIRDITPADITNAKLLDSAVKLIAWAFIDKNNQVNCGVEPMMVSSNNQLSSVESVYNAVKFEGDMIGEVLFYGPGAGKLPTASAVVADVMDAIRNGSSIHNSLYWQADEPRDGFYVDDRQHNYYVRPKNPAYLEEYANLAGASIVGNNNAVVINNITASNLQKQLSELEEKNHQAGVVLRLLA